MTEAEIKKHIEEAEKSPKQIAVAVAGVSDRVLRYKPAPEKWSILEILGHLVDMETLYAYRMRQMLADENPAIAPIDQDAWARNLGYLQSNPMELVALFGLNRHANLQLVRRLNPSDLEKSAYHPELKRPVTVAEMVEKMVIHGPNHLQQIEKLKRSAVQVQ
jgi:hypothetical protein